MVRSTTTRPPFRSGSASLSNRTDSVRGRTAPFEIVRPGSRSPGPDQERLRELAGVALHFVERAFLTDRALPDRERRWLDAAGYWPEVLHDVADAYGWEPPQERFRPTRADLTLYLTVMAWICWLEKQVDGKRDSKILALRAFGVPIHAVAGRFGRSDETIRRWQSGAAAAIASRFWAEIEDLIGDVA